MDFARDFLSNTEYITDSSIEDFCEENNLDILFFEREFCHVLAEGTACEGCKNVVYMNSGLYPCNSCSRKCGDHYENEV